MESEITSDAKHAGGERENYHYYMITLKPSFTSYVNKSKGNSDFMTNIFEIFMTHFCNELKFVDCGVEYDSKNVCHIHVVLASKGMNLNINHIINFKRGIYVDFNEFPEEELDRVIDYINKGSNEPHKIMQYYRDQYGFI